MSDGDMREQAKKKLRRSVLFRTLLLIAVCGVASFAVLAVRLYKLQITEKDFYESRALQNQLNRTTLTASRGSILDTNGKILAMSAAVENVFISPYEFERDNQDVTFIAMGLSNILGIPRELIEKSAENTVSGTRDTDRQGSTGGNVSK